MKVKLVEVYNSVSVMNKILDAELPASVAFKLTKLLKSLNDEIEDQRVKLVSKQGQKDENGSVSVSEANKEEFMKEFGELLSTEIEIQWEPVSVEKFDGLNLSANDLLKVGFLFSE
jgi:putative IMPACT (imprinted ancient) family translation regulator